MNYPRPYPTPSSRSIGPAGCLWKSERSPMQSLPMVLLQNAAAHSKGCRHHHSVTTASLTSHKRTSGPMPQLHSLSRIVAVPFAITPKPPTAAPRNEELSSCCSSLISFALRFGVAASTTKLTRTSVNFATHETKRPSSPSKLARAAHTLILCAGISCSDSVPARHQPLRERCMQVVQGGGAHSNYLHHKKDSDRTTHAAQTPLPY